MLVVGLAPDSALRPKRHVTSAGAGLAAASRFRRRAPCLSRLNPSTASSAHRRDFEHLVAPRPPRRRGGHARRDKARRAWTRRGTDPAAPAQSPRSCRPRFGDRPSCASASSATSSGRTGGWSSWPATIEIDRWLSWVNVVQPVEDVRVESTATALELSRPPGAAPAPARLRRSEAHRFALSPDRNKSRRALNGVLVSMPTGSATAATFPEYARSG